MRTWLPLMAVCAICLVGTEVLILGVGPASAQVSQDSSDNSKLIQTLLERQQAQTQFAVISASVVAVLAAVIGFFASWLTSSTSRKMAKDELAQALLLARESGTMKLVEQLGGQSLPIRIAAATLLFAQVKQAKKRATGSWLRSREIDQEPVSVLKVLVSATKEDQPNPKLAKLIGDELVKVAGAILPPGTTPKARSASPLCSFGGEPLDLQNVKFFDVYWRRVDARGVDFYRADFAKAGLRDSFLQKAVFFEAQMAGCVLCNANLFEANFEGADLTNADLSGANLCGAKLNRAVLTGAKLKGAKTDKDTVWPVGFDAKAVL